MSPLKFFLLLLSLCTLFLCTYVYFVFHPFPFTYTSKEKAFIALNKANISDEDIAALFAANPLSQEKIEQYLALEDENVYRLLARVPSLSRPDFLYLWKISFSCASGQDIRLSLIACQQLNPLEVEQILHDEFNYALWSALAQNPFLSKEQSDKLLSLTPNEFKESIHTLQTLSPRQSKCVDN